MMNQFQVVSNLKCAYLRIVAMIRPGCALFFSTSPFMVLRIQNLYGSSIVFSHSKFPASIITLMAAGNGR